MHVFIDKFKVNNFRKLKDLEEVQIGRCITVISGHNGVGKSSIMSLIASTVGLNRQRLNGTSFQPQFDDYFTIDPDREEKTFKNYNILVNFLASENGKRYEFTKRVGFKDDRSLGRGIRPLPRPSLPLDNVNKFASIQEAQENAFEKMGDIVGKSGSGRVQIPTIYISLSRIMPPGETKLTIAEFDSQTKKLAADLSQKYVEWYNDVLPHSITKDAIIAKYVSKKSTGKNRLFVLLDDASASTQSVGQDNLGGIISALVDFYFLSKKTDDYRGGILCIDEIEASLHPNAQIKLMLLLDKLSKELNLQILITSHSLTILREILSLQKKTPSAYRLIYFKGVSHPYISGINNYRSLKADLFNEISQSKPSIKVYCEDKFTVNLLKSLILAARDNELLSSQLPEYEIVNISLGKDALKGLARLDSHFRHVLIILDGDAKIKKNIKIEDYLREPNIFKGLTPLKLDENILCLPGFMSPEEFSYSILWEYINNESDHLKFWRSLERNPELELMTSDKARELYTPLGNKVTFDNIHDDRTTGLLDFVKKSRILSDYYSSDKRAPELKEWANGFVQKMLTLKEVLESISY